MLLPGNMKELQDIVRAWRARPAERFALATVIETRGSTYRRPGAHMLVGADGSTVGAVSGGCLERDVVDNALEVLAGGRTAVSEHDTTEPDDAVFGTGLGCRGIVRVLIEPLPASREAGRASLLSFAAATLERTAAGVAAVVLGEPAESLPRLFLRADGGIDGPAMEPYWQTALLQRAEERLALGRSGIDRLAAPGGAVEVFFEIVEPRPRLFLFGAGYDAVPVVRIARELGFAVTVVDSRPALASPARFPEADAVLLLRPEQVAAALSFSPRTAVVLMTHSYVQDRALLEELLPASLPYLGVLGPKQRTADLVESIRAAGSAIPEAAFARLKSPVGLDLGAETPEQIALAILAEIQAVFAGHSGGALSERRGPIHEPAGHRPSLS